jgi:hypothetical protein
LSWLVYSILSLTQASNIGELPGLIHFYPSSFINAKGFVKKPCLKARDKWRSLVQPYRLVSSHCCCHTCPRFLSSHFGGLQVLYLGAISDHVFYRAYLFHVVAICICLCNSFIKLKLVFFERLSYNEMTQCTCTDVWSFIWISFIFFELYK